MLELCEICVSFGEKRVLDACSLTIPAGGRVALMGPSGCGKTTLLRVALRLQAPDRGHIRGGFERVAAVFQEPRLLPWRTAAENVNAVLSDSPKTLPEAEVWLARFELGDACSLYPEALSGGMQQRVSLARAVASRAELLVLDEPFRGLDEALRKRIITLIGETAPHAAILMSTHSEQEALALGCRVLRYADGRFIPKNE